MSGVGQSWNGHQLLRMVSKNFAGKAFRENVIRPNGMRNIKSLARNKKNRNAFSINNQLWQVVI
ncbi:hypothetical protein ABIE12_002761 [Serratia sp. 509]